MRIVEAGMTVARLRLGVLALWLLASAILLAIAWGHIQTRTMWDADDYLRLQQLRDWLGGQRFTDVVQYRIDPPNGVAMHWSRIVDLPLAALFLALKPLFGAALAERIAISAVPLVTLGASLSALALLGTRLADHRTGLFAAMLAAAAPLLLFHLLPLRIDHHGWQTSCGLFALAASFDRKARRGGSLAGLFAALWLAISLEALPMVAMLGAVLALRYVIEGDGAAADRLAGFVAAFALGGIALFALFHDAAAWFRPYCDAVGPAWAGPMVAAPALVALLMPMARRRGVGARIMVLLVAGTAGVALLAAEAPACLDGPFAALDPLVRQLWYENVPEGLPVWRQSIDNRVLLIGFPLVGLAGAFAAWRRAATAAVAHNWLTMLVLMAAAYATSLLVQRAGAFAHGCALPGAAWLLVRLLDAIGRWRRVAVRVPAAAAAILLLSPVGALTVGNLATARARSETPPPPAPACRAPCDRFGALAALPRSYILAGLDITPQLLTTTPHAFAGSGHHRDPAAIGRVLRAFVEPPETAHRIMKARDMAYVLIDPDGNEAGLYSAAGPDGLMARLLRGRPPAWLVPVPLKGSPLRLWRRAD